MKDQPAFANQLERNRDGFAISGGMTLRDYFAAQAMTGLLTAEIVGEYSNDHVAEIAYRIADAMMKAREE